MPLKGWITGWLGMLLAFVGYDAIHGVPRFTFDIPALYDGISYVAILIGLFGLAEIMKVLPQREHTPMPENVGRAIPSFDLLIKHMPAALRSGLIGTVIGAIPGAGANIAAFLAYDVGRRRAKPGGKGEMGQGQLRGHRLRRGRQQRLCRRLDAADADARHSRQRAGRRDDGGIATQERAARAHHRCRPARADRADLCAARSSPIFSCSAPRSR